MTILYSEPIILAPFWPIMLFTVCLIAGIILIVTADPFIHHISLRLWAGIFFSVIALILLWHTLAGTFDYDTGRYKYYCTFDESISISEFCQKYEIVEQKGNLWIIQDINRED